MDCHPWRVTGSYVSGRKNSCFLRINPGNCLAKLPEITRMTPKDFTIIEMDGRNFIACAIYSTPERKGG